MKRMLNLMLDGLETKSMKSVFCLYIFVVLTVVPIVSVAGDFFNLNTVQTANLIMVLSVGYVIALFIAHLFIRKWKGL